MSTKRQFFFDYWERELLLRALDQFEYGLSFDKYSNATKEQRSAAEDAEWQEEAMRLAGEWVECVHNLAPDGAAIEALRAHIATRPQAATSKEAPDGRDVELRSSVHGAIPVGLHAHLPLAGGEPTSLTDRLWNSPEVMSLNAELGLTMEQLVRLARAVQPLLPAPPTKTKENGA